MKSVLLSVKLIWGVWRVYAIHWYVAVQIWSSCEESVLHNAHTDLAMSSFYILVRKFTVHLPYRHEQDLWAISTENTTRYPQHPQVMAQCLLISIVNFVCAPKSEADDFITQKFIKISIRKAVPKLAFGHQIMWRVNRMVTIHGYGTVVSWRKENENANRA